MLTPTTTELLRCPGHVFAVRLAAARTSPRGAYLTPYSARECAGMRCYLHASGLAGGALRLAPDGVWEAVAIFNVGASAGTGCAILRALAADGATRLDCLGEGLRDLYASHGWRVTQTFPWDAALADPRWHPDDGTPNLYVMERS